MIMPAIKRADPRAFEGKTVLDGFDILGKAYWEDSGSGGLSAGRAIEPGHVLLFMRDSPLPCQYLVGVVKGLLEVFGVQGAVT
jgi:hypothetical protein